MPCEHMGILLSRYVDGEASEDDRRLVEGHVRECGDCRQELEVFRRNENLLSQAFSEEVAGEAFIADVLAKAGLAPSRPSPARKALRSAMRTVGAWFSTPARVAAALLFTFSGYLCYAAVTLHRHNDELIADVSSKMENLQKANERYERLLVQIQSQQAPSHDVVKTPAPADVPGVAQDPNHNPIKFVPVEPPARQPEPDPEVVQGTPGELFHFVAAVPEDERVFLYWETAPTEGKVTFNILRKTATDADYGKPINSAPFLQLCYYDTTAAPLSTYSYVVVGVHENGASDRSQPIEVRTQGDLYIQNNGVLRIGNVVRSIMEVRKYVHGQWQSQTFDVAEGEPIGKVDPKSGLDFSTGCMLTRVEESSRSYNLPQMRIKLDANKNPIFDAKTKRLMYDFVEVPIVERTNRATIQDSGKKDYPLWKGEGRRGKVGSLE